MTADWMANEAILAGGPMLHVLLISQCRSAPPPPKKNNTQHEAYQRTQLHRELRRGALQLLGFLPLRSELPVVY